jgi:nucleoside-diphosphate-sugar epimerase
VRHALVTGATGLVGSYIVERLLADGWSVRALVRSQSAELTSLGVELVSGDVLDAESFAKAAEGCDIVYHAAAVIMARGGWEAYRRPNVVGTSNAIAAAERAGARLLQLSSVAVYSKRYEDPSKKTDEDSPMAPLPERAFYGRSKRESEQLVLEAHAAGRIWATTVRPCVIYGRRDRHCVPRAARVLQRGFAPVIGGGRSTMALVHAANVADGAVLAAMSDAAGGRAFNLANDFEVTVRDFFLLGAEGLGCRVHLVPIPLIAAQAGFAVLYRGLRLLSGGRASFLSRESLSMISRDNPFDSSRARRELGWVPRVRPAEGIPDAFRWWRETQNRKH